MHYFRHYLLGYSEINRSKWAYARGMSELMTVYRSADSSAEKEGHQVAAMLVREGIAATLLDDRAPGVIVGSVEVRVPAADSSRAEELIAKKLPIPMRPTNTSWCPCLPHAAEMDDRNCSP
jgi:hypothetical protein